MGQIIVPAQGKTIYIISDEATNDHKINKQKLDVHICHVNM